jgi:hypothetical protein
MSRSDAEKAECIEVMPNLSSTTGKLKQCIVYTSPRGSKVFLANLHPLIDAECAQALATAFRANPDLLKRLY